jgi:glutaredoxin
MDASSPPLPDLVLYGRAGCHLCDEAHETLTSLLDERRRNGRSTPTLQVRDIDTDPAWQDAFSTTIPVVELGDRRLELVTSATRLRRLLTDVLGA